MKKRWGIFFLLLFFLTSCGSQGQYLDVPEQQEGFFLDTYIQIKIYDRDKRSVLEQAFQQVEKLDKQLSSYRAGSEIDQVNQSAGQKPVKVSKKTFELVKTAYEYSKQSEGLFDLTIGPIVQLWRVGTDEARKPTQEEIDAALIKVDYQKVQLNETEQSVYLKESGMSLDLGGIAKGFISDQIAAMLREAEVTSAILDFGGNIIVIGKNPSGKAWTVGIQDPKEPSKVIGTIQATDQAVITSGNYQRYSEFEGQRYHHLMNPQTGYPFESGVASVTVVASNATQGDALSTTLFGLGENEQLQSEEEVGAVFIDHENRIDVTPKLEEQFTAR
ncbi:FAD:protein FMN transferase [Enterococcus florum]|uniref:FAD:protein FMN transferase n=1 Tax=Enterococcus florum TaxID=2480627 RepID=A0A4P5PE71_9ENTE|nr:FAD:protein FMN transferase [Enterococcus florum]GCF94591.1 FAD:protein FMN transferase [Enterococcus florum]